MAEQEGDGPFFSKALIEKWMSLPADKPLVIPVGRLQVDALMLSVRQSIIAQSHTAFLSEGD